MISSVLSTSTLALPAGVRQNEPRKSFGNVYTCRALHTGELLTAELLLCSARQHSGQSDSKEPLSVLQAWFRSLLPVDKALADKAVATHAWPCARDTGHNHLAPRCLTSHCSAFCISDLVLSVASCTWPSDDRADPQQNQLQSANHVARASRVCTQSWWCGCRK